MPFCRQKRNISILRYRILDQFMTDVNKHGLSRYVPVDVEREIRRRSKFGCVICRDATPEYEHIEPKFENAKEHDPDKMCLLCPTCNRKVDTGPYTKNYVRKKYKEVREGEDTRPAKYELDFHNEEADLLIAGNEGSFSNGITFSVHGRNILYANPDASKGAEIYATFNDEKGRALSRIIGDQWVVFDKAWDVEVEGSRKEEGATYSVHSSEDTKVLELKDNPPGKIIVEHVDMKINSFHLMATKNHFIFGRYVGPNSCFWVTGSVDVNNPAPSSTLIEATPPQGENFSIHPTKGILVEPYGISIAPSGSSLGHSLLIESFAYGIRSVPHVRKYFFEAAKGGGMLDQIDGQHLLDVNDLDAFSLLPPPGS